MVASSTEIERHPLLFKLLHLAIVGSVILLIITGFYIHRPAVDGGGVLMSLSRGVHFLMAGVLVVSTLIRLWRMFVGRNRDWRSFTPGFADIKLIPKVLKYYTYIGKEVEIKKKYNPLQMISYCGIFVLIIFQIISGIAILNPNRGWMDSLNHILFNGEIYVRMAHYVVNWLFVIFIMIHVYLAIRENFSEIAEMYFLKGAAGKEPEKERE